MRLSTTNSHGPSEDAADARLFSLPLIELFQPALHCVSIVILGDFLQEVESLLEHT